MESFWNGPGTVLFGSAQRHSEQVQARSGPLQRLQSLQRKSLKMNGIPVNYQKCGLFKRAEKYGDFRDFFVDAKYAAVEMGFRRSQVRILSPRLDGRVEVTTSYDNPSASLFAGTARRRAVNGQ